MTYLSKTYLLQKLVSTWHIDRLSHMALKACIHDIFKIKQFAKKQSRLYVLTYKKVQKGDGRQYDSVR